MDKSYMYQYIDWNNLKVIPWKSEDETFEFLCADFMKIKYGLTKSPSIWWKTYKWTEWPPEKGPDGLLYGFQSKFSNNSFHKECLYESCENIWDWTEVLCIFTKDEYPSDKNSPKSYIKWTCPSKNKSSWESYFDDLRINKNIKKIDKFCWDSFIKELKQSYYFEICEKYFNIDMKEIYEKCENKDDVCNIKLTNDIENVENWFEWIKEHYQHDIPRAKLIQKSYSYKKLSYSAKPWIWEKFEVLEKDIADELFDELSVFWNFSSFRDYLNETTNLINGKNNLKKHLDEIENLISERNWLFVNYWTQWLSCLNYIQQDKIEFKDKRNG